MNNAVETACRKMGVADGDIPAARWDKIALIRRLATEGFMGDDSRFARDKRSNPIEVLKHKDDKSAIIWERQVGPECVPSGCSNVKLCKHKADDTVVSSTA